MLHLIDSPYDGQPLTDKNIGNYILSNELNATNIRLREIKELDVKPFLQKDFRTLEQDCTFTSILTCVHYFYPQVADVQTIYDVALNIYKREYPQYQKVKGTVPFAIRSVYNEIYKYFKLHFYTIRSKYVNKIGFSYKDIKTQIDNGIPVILSFYNDRRKYYKNHTVTVIGYAEFEMDNMDPVLSRIKPIKTKNMLIIYDNWSTDIRYLDLDLIGPVSSIVF